MFLCDLVLIERASIQEFKIYFNFFYSNRFSSTNSSFKKIETKDQFHEIFEVL